MNERLRKNVPVRLPSNGGNRIRRTPIAYLGGIAAVLILATSLTVPSPNVASRSEGSPQAKSLSKRSSRAEAELSPQSASNLLAKLPVRFEKNLGQTDPEVKFLVRRPGFSLFLTDAGAVFALQGGKPGERTSARKSPGRAPAASDGKPDAVRMSLVGAKSGARISGVEALSGRTNYVRGNDPGSWKTNIPAYAKVRYEEVYPGIDMVFRGGKGFLEYDLMLAPGADPNAIEIRFEGAKRLELDRGGDLIVSSREGTLRQRKPHIFQKVGGRQKAVEGGFVLKGKRVRFRIGDYDKRLPLVIDPVMTYSTYLGGPLDGSATSVSVDPSGFIYLAGSGLELFPTQAAFQPAHRGPPGSQEAWLAKFVPDGSELVYSTYLGGSEGEENGSSVASDAAGNAYLVGLTRSRDFPTTPNNAFQATTNDVVSQGGDAFLTKFDPIGIPVYSTYLGGDGAENAYAVALDPESGKVFLTGDTNSDPDDPFTPAEESFPTTSRAVQPELGGLTDVFLTAIDTSKSGRESLVYSTYLGAPGWDVGKSIAADAGVAYVTGLAGEVADPPGPAAVVERFKVNGYQEGYAGGEYDAFFAAIDTNEGSVSYSTLLGGQGTDEGRGVAIDPDSGRVSVVGVTHAPATGESSFPTRNNALQAKQGRTQPTPPNPPAIRADGFLATFDPSASGDASLVYATFFGGSQEDYLSDVAVDGRTGHLAVTGATASSTSDGFPIRNPIQDPKNFGEHQGRTDVVVARLDTSRSGQDSLLYSSFLGGPGEESGRSVTVGRDGHIWIAGRNGSIGGGGNGGYPVRNAYQPEHAGSGEAVLSKLEAVLPIIDRIDPVKGPVSGGTQVAVEGRHLQGAYRVKFGEVEAANITVDPASPNTRLVAESPPHAAGPVHVRVTTHEGISNETPADVFTFENAPQVPSGEAPFIAALTPPRGPTTGGTPVVIAGTRFSGATEVRFGDVVIPASRFSSATDSDIRLSTPPHPREETVQVRVVTPEGVSNPAPFTFFVEPVPAPLPPAPPSRSNTLPSGEVTNSQRPALPAPPAGSGFVGGPSTVPVTVPQPAPGPASAAAPTAAPAPEPGSAPTLVAGSLGVPTPNNAAPAIGAAGMPEEEQPQPAPKYNMVDGGSAERDIPLLLVTAAALFLGCGIRAAGRRRDWTGFAETAEPEVAFAWGGATGGGYRAF